MLLIHCSACNFRHLRGIRGIEQIDHTHAGIVVTANCIRCGHSCRLLTGAGSDPDPGLPDQRKPVA